MKECPMKSMILALMVSCVLSASAFAGEKLVCNEYSRRTSKLLQTTVVLTPMKEGEIREGQKFPYRLERFVGAEVMANLEVEGTVLTEDVSFEFTSKDKKLSFHVYMDEMNESGLTLEGKTSSYICR
jgi:hypothetical protein